MRKSVRRSEKGFTLIELGIVVAVIAILATVVLFGRGFLTSAGTSKAIEAVNSIRKAAATYNGVVGGQGDLDAAGCLQGLVDRELLPPAAVEGLTPANSWEIGGVVVTECIIEGPGTNLQIEIEIPEVTTAEDMDIAIGDQGDDGDCTGTVGTTGTDPTTLNLCFQL